MSQPQTRVFLSSTSQDLGVFRAAAADAVIQHQMHPIMMERFPAASRDAVDVCEAQVAEADVLIGIYAQRYGYCPKDSDYSITEMEYRWAEAHGIDCLVFIFDPANATLLPDDPLYQYADDNPKMQVFLNYVGQQVVWKTFTSPDDLKHKVYIALEAWKERPARQKWFRSVRAIPGWARAASLLLLVLTVGMLVYSLALLLRAGQQSLGMAAGGIGLVIAVLPVLNFFWKTGQGFFAGLPGIERLKPWGLTLLLQVAIAGVVLLGSPLVLQGAAEDLVNQALVSTDLNEARAALNDAQTLGVNVAGILDAELSEALTAPNLPEENKHAVQLARLLVDFAPEQTLRERVSNVETGVRQAAQAGSEAQTQRLMQVLAILDVQQAGMVARNFYQEALASYVAKPPQTAAALTYLNAFLVVNELTDTGLSRVELSYAHQLRGALLETNDASAALEAYHQALVVDDTNLEARYALASALLVQVENGGDTILLNEAIEIARVGHQDYIPQEFCRGTQNLNVSEVFRKSWNCFLLLTTEAGARIMRTGGEDTLNIIRGLLERAIYLAEANNHFGDNRFTAEVYYWLARAIDPNPATEEGKTLYCAIIQHHDATNPRHRKWVAFANEKLEGQFCLPTPVK